MPNNALPPSPKALTAEEAGKHLAQLIELLVDAVDSGASIGFLPPLGATEAGAYWNTVIAAMREGHRELIAVVEEGAVLGAVQLLCETRANGVHRAEAGKLFVLRTARRRGLARALMAELTLRPTYVQIPFFTQPSMSSFFTTSGLSIARKNSSR